MKKFLLSLAAAALCTTAMAETATITFSDKYSENTVVDGTAIDINDNVAVTFSKGTGSTPPQYYTNGTSVRWYGGGTMTVSSDTQTITKIEITFGGSDGTNAISANEGTFDSPVWTGSASTVVFTEAGTSGNRRIAGITVTYGEGSGEGGDTETPENPGGDDNPDNPGGDDNGNVTEVWSSAKGGFTTGTSSSAPTTPTTQTSTATGIVYTFYQTVVNSQDYLFIKGGSSAGYVSWTLDFDCSQLQLTTSGSGSTQTTNKVTVYANDEAIETDLAVNAQNNTYTINIPDEYQAAGTVYKVLASGSTNTQFASFTYVKVGNEGQEPEEPDQPDQPVEPTGTITVAEALALINGGTAGDGKYQVAGIISSINEVSISYGNATFDIVDAEGDANALTVFRCKWIGNVNFTSEDQIVVGGKVVVEGTLTLYGTTPEVGSGGVIISYEAPTGDTPTPPTPDEPEGESVTFDFNDLESLGIDESEVDPSNGYDLTGMTLESGNVSILCEGEGASTPIRIYGSTGNYSFRFYKDTQFTVSVPENYYLTGIVFNGSNLGKDWSYSNGSLTDSTWTPEGDVSEVTIGKTATGNNPSIKTMKVYYVSKGSENAVEAIEAVDGEAVYYNLQGVKVQNPERGIYVKVQNGKAVKVVK